MAVLNKHKDGIPKGAVYIGRGSRWGNPFSHLTGTKAAFIVKDRNEACDKHAQYLDSQIERGEVSLQDLAALHGKDLVCFCAPLRCHGHTLEKKAAWAAAQLNLDQPKP